MTPTEKAIEDSRERIEFLESENELLTRFFEQFGDLSCCYDAKDVISLGQRRIDAIMEEK